MAARKFLRAVLIVLSLSIFNRRFAHLFRASAIKILLIAIGLSSVQLSTAQKYPERRATRQGTRLYDKGDYAGAEAAYRRGVEMNPGLKEAAYNLGGALWRQAQATAHDDQTEQEKQAIQAQALEATETWMAIATDSLAPAAMVSAAGYNAGNVALAAQQFDAAIEAYKGALRLNPDDMEAKFNLAYAQKLKQQQDQNEQNQDKNDQNQDKNDRNDNQNSPDNENNSQNREGDGENDPQNGDGRNGDGQNDPQNNGGDGNEPPPPSGQGQGGAKIDPQAAEQMLDAMQAAEDDTREKVNAKEVRVGARSGKNW